MEPKGAPMIEFYCWPTPNGHKSTMFLEEVELEYTIHPVDISAGAEHRGIRDTQEVGLELIAASNGRVQRIVSSSLNRMILSPAGVNGCSTSLAASRARLSAIRSEEGLIDEMFGDSATRRLPMNRGRRVLRALQRTVDLPRAGVFAAPIAVLLNTITCVPVHAQQADVIEQKRLEAPIGHRQPRPRDLPPSVLKKGNNVSGPKALFDVGPDINICRGC
jgi:hypothetical protein